MKVICSPQKYTEIDKASYDLYIQDVIEDRDVYDGYYTPGSDVGFQNFVKDHKIYNNCYHWYNDKGINQKIRKLKLEKINESR